MYGRRDKGIDITDHLTGGDFLFFLNERLASSSYMLTEKNRQLFRGGDTMNRNILGNVLVVGWVYTAGES